MAQPRVLVLRAPGTNCDAETAHAFQRAGGIVERIHVNRLLEGAKLLERFQVLCLPGGFSYGDDVAAGRILGNQLRSHLGPALAEFNQRGKLILGICNGFQVLIKAGLLLPDDPPHGARATLTWNDSGRFEDRWVNLRTSGRATSVFFAGIDSMYLPVAHAEGKFVPRDESVLAELEQSDQIVLRYASASANGGRPDPSEPLEYPHNPNGSVGNIAGMCDATGRICGLMPHPERHIERTQHPRWTREDLPDEGDGMQVFKNAVSYFR